MKIIFLDIDGVLNCAKTHNPRKLPYIVDPKLLKRLKRLLELTGAKIVLSSTWRYDPAGLFSAKYWGIPYIDVIPDMPKKSRCEEVRAWLKAHPKVKRFVVIDDEDDGLDELPLFQPSASTGLTKEIVAGVTEYLSGKTDKDMRNSAVVRAIENIASAFRRHPG
jgi:HAD domain in Swiss Army Knife RNA repair proteins